MQFVRIKVMGKAGNFIIVFGDENISLFDIDKNKFIRSVRWNVL